MTWWRRPSGHRGWARVFAVVVVVLGLVAYLNIVSHERGAANNQTAACLQSLGLLLNEESALQWKTLADQSAPARVAREIGTIRGREKDLLTQLQGALPDATNRELRQLITEYQAVLDQELGLLVVGLTSQATNLEWAQTDPKFKRLSERITSLSAAAVARARDATATADDTLIGAMVLTAMVIGGLLRRFERAHRAAARASAELLKQQRSALLLAHENAVAVRHQAEHDALTGLPNRLLFTERVQDAMAAEGDRTVIFVDLDEFKRINDSLGHSAGDALLVEVAGRLRHSVRTEDMAARLGGDEFAILVNGGVEVATRVAERIITALQEPVDAGGTQVLTQASVGIATVDADQDADRDAAELLRNADVAMYEAKRRGKGQWAVFDQSMHDPLRSRVGLEVDLRRALEGDELFVVYQPIVDLESARIVGAEALVRWAHPTQGTISPAAFLPVAEASGLILGLGRRVLRDACAQAARWIAARPGERFTISVNLSAHQLHHPTIVDDIRAVLDVTGLPATSLMLELTESAVVHNRDLVAEKLRDLRALGVGVALDDFGTGYSSLTHLQCFVVDQIKVDRSFTATDDKVGEVVLRLGQMLQVETVAEGIETLDQALRARDLGCHNGQGYWFARPVPVEEFEELLYRPGPLVDLPQMAEGVTAPA